MTTQMPKVPLILYFFAASEATAEELVEVASLRGRIQHRTAAYVESDHKPEQCDGVAGSVPDSYKKFPSAEKAYEKYEAALKKLAKSDKPAPKAGESGELKAWSGSGPKP